MATHVAEEIGTPVPVRQVPPIVIVVHGADECPRCSLPGFNWLECTCGLFCRTTVNCNGLRERRSR